MENTAIDHHRCSPFTRLAQLLKPDVRDLWIVVTYAAVIGVLALATPIAVEQLVTTVAFGALFQPLLVLAFILFVFLSFGATLTALQTVVVELLQRRIAVRVVSEVAHRFSRLYVPALDTRHGPELVNRVFEVVTVQKSLSYLLLDGVAVLLQTVVGMAVLAFYHPALLGFDLFLLLAILLIMFLLGQNAVRTAIAESHAKYEFAWWLEELARHPLTFKLRGASEHALQTIDGLMHHYLRARASHFRILMRQIVFALLMQVVASTLLLGWGGWLVISGELTLGQLIAAQLIVATIVGAFAKLGKYLDSFYDLLAACDKLGFLFDIPVERDTGAARPAAPASNGSRVALHGLVVERGAGFRNGPFDIDVAPGSRIALTGSPGCGKSTLLETLFCVRPASAGYVVIDGVDQRDVHPQACRDHVALVGPVEIFAGTIEQNILLDRPGISVSEVSQSLVDVGLFEEVSRLPAGLQTRLETDGAPLTKSQCRRLMLARAILDQPRLLLLDGVLDALPDKSLAPMLDYLFDRSRPWTLIVATGREAIAERCDQVWEMRSAQPRGAAGES